MKIERKAINAFIIMTQALSHEKRLNVLYSLYEKPKTWTELIFEVPSWLTFVRGYTHSSLTTLAGAMLVPPSCSFPAEAGQIAESNSLKNTAGTTIDRLDRSSIDHLEVGSYLLWCARTDRSKARKKKMKIQPKNISAISQYGAI